jgi:mono/diheme cytochrome c family protein
MKNTTLAATAAFLAGTAFFAGTAVRSAAAGLSAAQTGSASIGTALPPRVQPATGAQASQSLVTTYCVTCHNARLKTGGLALDGLDLARLPEHADVWEKVVRKVRAGVMPPQGVRRPEPQALQQFVAYVEDGLDRDAAQHPDPGRPMLHRLNRAEYKNAIRDLLALDVDVSTLLPPDDSAFGFDNISDVLGVSPSLQERYLAAAGRISALAVGDPSIRAGSDTYRVPQDLSQNQHVEGLPLGTIGGLKVRHTFPLDGEYDFQTKLYRTNLDMVRGLQYASEFEIAIDGKPVHRVTIGGNPDLVKLFEAPTDTGGAVEARMRVRVKVPAGPHDVTAAFVDNLMVKDTVRVQPFLRSSADNFDWAGQPHIQTFAITGPFEPTGSGDTPSRRAVFTCRPPSPASAPGGASAGLRRDERACAAQILGRLARRAYRQPVAAAELEPILAFYDDARARGTFEAGIQRGLQRILASPRFVFRLERDPAGAVPGSVRPVTGLELASRLSFFLWSSLPDEPLLRAAAQGTLTQPEVLDRQVRRMLADPRAEALVTNFAGQWLHLRNVRSVQPNSDEFPDFDDNLRQAFRRETELLFSSIVREDRNVLDLLRADYTFVNERLARHYGIPGIYGSRFRRVPVTDDARRGILGQGSMLAVTSHAERTSPVLRGKWVLENLLGLPVPPPPPDVPTLKGNSEGEKPRTLREQLAEHRADPVCASCHKVMDPVGFALENFDAVGAWRTQEPGGRIDATGQLADGTKVDGVVTLRNAILDKPDVFVATLTEKLMIYALGRGVDARDMPAVRAVMRRAAANDYNFSSIVLGIVRSVPFRMRTTPGASDAETTRTAQVQ